MSVTMEIGYGQARPSEAAAIQSLADLVGDDGAASVWDSACDRVQVLRPVRELSALLLVAEALTASDVSLARVAGRSIVIRIASYSALSERGLL